MADVIVVGSGPTGMMLGAELVLAGVDVVILERRLTPDLVSSRAGGFHSRTIEIFDQRGIAERFLSAGQTGQTARFGTSTLDISDFPTRHPYGLGLWQNLMEPIMREWIEELGVRVESGRDVTSLSQDEKGVHLELASGEVMRAKYVVGADGGRSTVRKAAGIDFPGWPATRSTLIAETELADEPPAGVRYDERGAHGLGLMADGRTYRIVTAERQLGSAGEATMADLSASLTAVFGTDFGAHNPRWLSRFTDATRQAADYRSGRVLLAGDAAHIHYPAGGQGIGLGIQDAVNLGWKLAQVVGGISPDTLLDTYNTERHPPGARALAHSMAQTALQRHDPQTVALTETVDSLMAMDGPRRQIAALIHGLDIAYDLGVGHPLLGRRMPDLDLETSGGSARVYEFLREARPLLLVLDDDEWQFSVAASSSADRVQIVHATFDGHWELPVIGRVPAPSAVLVRPDGHVAWVGEGNDDGLQEALGFWFAASGEA